jgi:hypothetical protein
MLPVDVTLLFHLGNFPNAILPSEACSLPVSVFLDLCMAVFQHIFLSVKSGLILCTLDAAMEAPSCRFNAAFAAAIIKKASRLSLSRLRTSVADLITSSYRPLL